MNWDDLRFVLVVNEVGSLAKASQRLGVDHTTVGRRIEAMERALKVRLFTRTPAGYVPTADAQRLLAPMQRVEGAVRELEREVSSTATLTGPMRVTSPETLGATWLAKVLAQFQAEHSQVQLELVPSGQVLDLGRREAELAVRFFRSKQEHLVARRVATVGYGLYASHGYLKRRPVHGPERLHEHALLSSNSDDDLEARWLRRLDKRAKPAFTSPLSFTLLTAAKEGAGVAVLPCYLADEEPSLQKIAAPDAPSEVMWLTVHRDLRETPRVRALMDVVISAAKRDAQRLAGT